MAARFEGFDDFYRPTMPKVYRALLVTTGDPELAADATSEAFTSACVKWTDLENPSAWVWRVGYNYVKRYWKRIQNREVLESSLTEGMALTAEALAIAAPAAAETDLDLLKVVADLPAQQRAVMAGRHILDLRPIDVAKGLGISPKTESEHHKRALHTMRERLADWRTNE
jgi:RNA polymerase sigma factor (sigma-70 family)